MNVMSVLSLIERFFFNFFDKFQAGILLGSAVFWNDYYDAKASEMTNSLRAESSAPNAALQLSRRVSGSQLITADHSQEQFAHGARRHSFS